MLEWFTWFYIVCGIIALVGCIAEVREEGANVGKLLGMFICCVIPVLNTLTAVATIAEYAPNIFSKQVFKGKRNA
jgi:hypothetical protein